MPALALNTPEDLESLPIPDRPSLRKDIPFKPGEEEAARALSAFLRGAGAPIFEYSDGRNLLGEDGTSKLSPYLRFGMISARKVYSAARQANQYAQQADEHRGVEDWINELIWRDFYIHILHHFPEVRVHNFRLQAIPWINNREQFNAWKNGETGYPVVDAAMRQLLRSGWMHNRARMIVASFLTKDLLIDWRWGERWFMHCQPPLLAAGNGQPGLVPMQPLTSESSILCHRVVGTIRKVYSCDTGCPNWPMCRMNSSTNPGKCRPKSNPGPDAGSGKITRPRSSITRPPESVPWLPTGRRGSSWQSDTGSSF